MGKADVYSKYVDKLVTVTTKSKLVVEGVLHAVDDFVVLKSYSDSKHLQDKEKIHWDLLRTGDVDSLRPKDNSREDIIIDMPEMSPEEFAQEVNTILKAIDMSLSYCNRDHQRGENVNADALAVFDFLRKTSVDDARWEGDEIHLGEKIRISAPYRPECVSKLLIEDSKSLSYTGDQLKKFWNEHEIRIFRQ